MAGKDNGLEDIANEPSSYAQISDAIDNFATFVETKNIDVYRRFLANIKLDVLNSKQLEKYFNWKILPLERKEEYSLLKKNAIEVKLLATLAKALLALLERVWLDMDRTEENNKALIALVDWPDGKTAEDFRARYLGVNQDGLLLLKVLTALYSREKKKELEALATHLSSFITTAIPIIEEYKILGEVGPNKKRQKKKRFIRYKSLKRRKDTQSSCDLQDSLLEENNHFLNAFSIIQQVAKALTSVTLESTWYKEASSVLYDVLLETTDKYRNLIAVMTAIAMEEEQLNYWCFIQIYGNSEVKLQLRQLMMVEPKAFSLRHFSDLSLKVLEQLSVKNTDLYRNCQDEIEKAFKRHASENAQTQQNERTPQQIKAKILEDTLKIELNKIQENKKNCDLIVNQLGDISRSFIADFPLCGACSERISASERIGGINKAWIVPYLNELAKEIDAFYSTATDNQNLKSVITEWVENMILKTCPYLTPLDDVGNFLTTEISKVIAPEEKNNILIVNEDIIDFIDKDLSSHRFC